MNSSGIKRGLAITAVAAVAVGTPAAVFAASSGDSAVYAISQSADKSSLPQYSYATISGTASVKNDQYTYDSTSGANPGSGAHVLSVNLSETLPAGTVLGSSTDNDPVVFTYDHNGPDENGEFGTDSTTVGPGGADSATTDDELTFTELQTGGDLDAFVTANKATENSDGTYTLTSAVTLKTQTPETTPFQLDSNGKATNAFAYSVASSIAGTVTATTGTASAGGTASTSLTVTPVQSGPSKVATISVDPASVDQYESDPDPVYAVQALDSNGVPVNGVAIQVVETNHHGISPEVSQSPTGTFTGGSSATTSLATPSDDGTVYFRIPSSGSASTTVTDNLTFFVNLPASPSTGLDPSDPQDAVTAKFTKDPSSTTDYEITDASVEAADSKLPADNAAVSETVSVFLPAHGYNEDTNPVGAAGVRIAVDASGPGGYQERQVATTDADGNATVTFTIPKSETDPSNGTYPKTIGFTAYVSGSSTFGDYIDTIGNTDLSIQKRATFVDYNNSVDKAAASAGADNPADAQAVAGGTVSLPIVVEDQFGKPASNATLAYTVTDGRGNGTDSSVPLTTDANGQATITYTDKAENGATQAVHDTVYVYDPFGGVLATDGTGTGETHETGDLKIDVQFLTSLSADATKSQYGSGLAYLSGTTPANTDPNAAATDGVPAWAQVVSVDSNYIVGDLDPTTTALPSGQAAHDSYSVLLVSSDDQPLKGQNVTFSAPGGVLIDPLTDTDNPAFGLGTLTVPTDQNGVATVFLTAYATGDVTLTASAGDFTHTFNPVRFDPDKAYNLSVASAPTTVAPGTSSKYVYNVEDQFGNPIYGFGPDNVNPNFDTVGGVDRTGNGAAPDPDSTDLMAVAVHGSTGNATDPGMVTGADSTVDENSQAALVLTTLDSDTGTGTLVATGTGNVAAKKYAPKGVDATLLAALKEYNVKSGLATPFTVTNEPTTTKTDPTLKVTAKSKVTFTKKNGKKVKHNWDVITVKTNAPAGTAVKVAGKTHKVKANGKVGVFKFADKKPKKFRTYKVTVTASDTTNAKSVSKKVK